jgi:fructose-1,6-bisphosphatase I
MSATSITLTPYLLVQQQAHAGATGECSVLLSQIALAAKMIAHELSRAGLGHNLGATGEVNVQGEATQKLDVLANEAFREAFEYGQLVTELVSEEMEEPTRILGNERQDKYVIFVDPLDGSVNIDVDVTSGSIFSVHRRPPGSGEELSRALQLPGYCQIAAGYALYGPCTMLVYTAGNGIHGFTLDPEIREFLLSHEHIRIPAQGSIYSVNEGRRAAWLPPTRSYIDYLQQHDKASSRPYTARYVGSLVADFHRTLLKGEIFLYPADTNNKNGELRLMYEAAPVALIVEAAGGRASSGTQRILDIGPTSLHPRVPLLIGSPEDVARAESFYCEARA